MRLITTEMKDQLNWVPNPNNSQRERTKKKKDERENEKEHERKERKEVSGNVVPSVDANKLKRQGTPRMVSSPALVETSIPF
jgi:hypothetical protein